MTTTAAQRTSLVSKAHTLIDHEPQIHYSQIRPYPTKLSWADVLALLKAGKSLTADCSSSITLLFKWAGLHDPNGPAYHFNGYGYTGTLLAGPCAHYFNPAAAKLGAIVIFGPGTGEHAAMVIGDLGPNPLLFSHGMERGPIAIRLHDEAQYHNPPTTFLNISNLG